MASKVIYCAGCHIKVAVLVEGSSTLKGMVALCPSCETKRKMSDLAGKTKPKNEFDMFSDLLSGRR